MNSIAIAVLFAISLLLGALCGRLARARLPAHHLDGDTKDMVKIGVGFLATLAALVLGLVVASAKSTFDTRTQEVQAAAAKVIQLDDVLRRIGPPALPVRENLRAHLAVKVRQFDAGQFGQALANDAVGAHTGGEALMEAISRAAAADPAHPAAWARAEQLGNETTQIVAQASAQSGSSIMTPMLVLLGLWFSVIMAGWNIVSPDNSTTRTVNVLCAVSLAAAILLLLEMDRSYSGLVMVSSTPLHVAYAHLMAP